MPDYTDQTEMTERYGNEELVELTNLGDVSTGKVVAAVLSRAINDAEAFVNSYLRGRVDLPLTDVPQPIPKITSDIARYYLHGDIVTEIVQRNYEEALSWLKDVSSGRVNVALDSAETELAAVAGEATARVPGRTFTRDSLADFTGETRPRTGFVENI